MEILKNRESTFGLNLDLDRSGCVNPLTRRLIVAIFEKKSNLCLSADLDDGNEILKVAEDVGPHIVVLKTHLDAVECASPTFISSLQNIAKKHNFLLLEDRKFSDIGDTVVRQYTKGWAKIHDWADLVTAHVVSGSKCIESLAKSRTRPNRGCLAIAGMSCEGNLLDERFVMTALNVAKSCPDFVSGFISQSRITSDPNLLHFTPGVHIEERDTSRGQNYITPEEAILNRGADIIIVGRGILSSTRRVEAAIAYKERGFSALMKRLG